MTATASTSPLAVLSATEGHALVSGLEAIVKGAIEAETAVSLIAGPRNGAFAGLFRATSRPDAGAVLRQQGLRMTATADASRALTLAAQAAHSGRSALMLMPNALLDETMQEFARLYAVSLVRGGALCVVLEDDPTSEPAACPRQAAARLGLPAVEAGNVPQLRDAIDQSLLLSRAGRCITGVIAHSSVLRSAETIEVHANRVGRVVEVLHARRRRRIRLGLGTEGGVNPTSTGSAAVLRAARRLELNRFRTVPSPGERVSVGFITVGPADNALMHLVHVLQLHGRVPVLNLGMINPVDDSAVGRLLTRCERVLVLEPRPGTVEGDVLTIAERLRQRGESPASVWGRWVPSGEEGGGAAVASEEDLHPSILARKITHLLHEIRPSVHVASQLTPDPPPTPPVSRREDETGSMAAIAEVRRLLRDVDQWLHERAPLEERGLAPTGLALDGAESAGKPSRVVIVEVWEHARFLRSGPAAIVQAARDDRPWLLIVCETAGEEVADLERLARGVIPADRTDRARLEAGNLNDLVAFRDQIREATMRDGLTVLIVRDGPPARFDVAAIERSVSQTDLLGFEPRQRVVSSADEICSLRQTFVEDEQRQLAMSGSSLRTETSVEHVSERIATKFRLRIRPLLEEVEVTRVRPPRLRWRQDSAGKLLTPQIVHAHQAAWRVHVAGCRGEEPCGATIVLSEAAHMMGYHVRIARDPAPIGPGRRAWAQLLFTRPRGDENPLDITAVVPFGEADLLLGLDAREVIRAVSPDGSLRVAASTATSAVVNIAPFIDDHDFDAPNPAPREVISAIAAVTSSQRRLLADFASACRTWFHTDRVTDMAILGAAYQQGFIPVSAEAMEHGLEAAETAGFGRSREAFELGRRLALDDSLFTKHDDDAKVPLERIARRLALSMRHGLPGAASRARQLLALMLTSLEQMPGLAETDPGRQARRDFVMACHHCTVWGGLSYAETFADLITRLYQTDRGDTGRALTRAAVLPLAEVMLIRDPLYVAGLAASTEHRRRIRQRLHAKRARGDEVDRRYLTRIDLLSFGRRVRMDLRTSDWPTRLVAAIRRITPGRFRGQRRERLLRDFVIDFARRAIVDAPGDYERWVGAMLRLHDQAIEDRLRGMAMAEVRMLLGVGAESAESAIASR